MSGRCELCQEPVGNAPYLVQPPSNQPRVFCSYTCIAMWVYKRIERAFSN